MEWTISKSGSATVMALQGKLDSFSAKGFEEALLAVIAAGNTGLILDCAQLDYVSSAGLRIFYLAANRLQNGAGKIVFCGLNENLRRVFDIVDLASEFLILPTREEALLQF